MDSDLIKKAFQNASYHPESRLSDDIWCVINKKRKNNIKIKFWIYSILVFLSLGGIVPTFKTLLSQLSNSGFYQYLSLASSDSSIIASYWKEFVLSLISTLPYASLVLSIFLLFMLFISIRKVLEQFRSQLLVA